MNIPKDKMIKIREATRQDLPALISLYEQLEDIGDTRSNVKFPPEAIRQSQEIFTRLAHYPDYKVYLAQADDEIVGTFALLIMDSVPNGIPSGIIENLVVARPWRRKGIGRQLMQVAIQICKSKDCYNLLLASQLDNADAHRFYEALGLRKNGYAFALKVEV